MQCSMAEII